MESDQRPHHRSKSNSSSSTSLTTSTTKTITTSELLICFITSRLSSSSMRLSFKSLLGPGRARGDISSQISLSSSLSRRLRTSGSIKGGQASPMFPSNGGTNKKRGCAFENPEPTSPKVTCIGQVRVKTKKHGKKMRTISRSRRSRGSSSEPSFRKTEQQSQQSSSQSQELYNFENHQINNNNQQECLRHRNQRWVHLPLTICEALRAFRSEFNCLIPNRSSCLASEDSNYKEKEENKGVGISERGGSSCGAVFARWFVALHDGDGKEGREIELVVGEDQERTERSANSSGGHSQRRQVFEGIEFKEGERLNKGLVEEEEAGRVSISVPPKNALLLMRCRSDPVKIAALANRLWEMPAAPKDEEGEDEEENENESEDEGNKVKAQGFVEEEAAQVLQIGLKRQIFEEDGVCEKWVCDGQEHGGLEEVENLVLKKVEGEKEGLEENPEKGQQLCDKVKEEIEEKGECQVEVEEEVLLETEEEEEQLNVTQEASSEEYCLLQVAVGPKRSELEETYNDCEATHEEEEEEEEEVREAKLPEAFMESVQSEDELEEEENKQDKEIKTEAEVAEESNVEDERESVTQDRPEPVNPNTNLDTGLKRSGQNPVLPDCLLMMMCEPKLSRETWVCTTDFIRCLPGRHVKKMDGPDKAKRRVSIDKNPAAPVQQQQLMIQPPRSSCSFPVHAGPVSMATMIGQKMVGSTAYEPFGLTRCKSEPMRSAGKLATAPGTCFWKSRKMEPHRLAAMGVGAAGVGF